ncbi:hypothetical protein [Streptomyces sp. ITFR-6]|uniref:hypothetical protein n=1 Tax=Streptomyces sp. ITFR-6 TaxID=3075197 RepID=UPI00288AAA88|nr:hypothetical protein [Streptomyces sp. ITFR-6]WNI31376.1 hypothetical protein RLT59_23250 [Streptomyces sp. ITFR-6]
MTEDSALPLMLVFALASVLLVRSREVAWWHALLIFLFGIYTALTPIVFTVTGLVNWLLQRFTA